MKAASYLYTKLHNVKDELISILAKTQPLYVQSIWCGMVHGFETCLPRTFLWLIWTHWCFPVTPRLVKGTVRIQWALSWVSSAEIQPWSQPTVLAPVCWSGFTLIFQLEASSFSTSMVGTFTRICTSMDRCKVKRISSSSSPRQKLSFGIY